MSDPDRLTPGARTAAADRVERDSLGGALRVLRRRWLVIVGVVIAAVAASVANHAKAPKMYDATANVSFQSATLSDAALQVSPSGSGDPQRDADTQVGIAHSPEVARGVVAQLKTRATPDELLGQVSVEAAANADILNVKATTGNPQDSVRLANAFAQQYIAFKARAQLQNISAAEHQLEQQINALPAGASSRATLQQSLQRLGELRAVTGGGANVIGLATPSSKPAGTSLSMTVVLGIVLGFAVSFLLVFLLESLDRRMKSIEEFEREYRLQALAGVPQSAFRGRRADERGESLEPYRILRSALDFAAVTRRLDTLLITSAVSGEGKTTVAVDLAHTIALTGRPVVLIELDLRRPTFAEHFRLDPGNGLTHALMAGEAVGEMLVEPFAELPNFSVLPSGRLPHNPSELLGSQRITDIITELVPSEGIVVIDAPPLNPVADSQVLLNNPVVHASMVVARVGKTTRDEVRRARAILDRNMIEPVGIVVTGLRDAARYGYGPYRGAASEFAVDVDAPLSRPPSASARRRLPL